MTTTAVIPSCSVEAIIAERDAIVAAALRIHEIANALPNGFPDLRVLVKGHAERWDVAMIAKDADRSGWNRIMAESGLWTFLDHTAREQWRKALDDGTFPPLTLEAAQDFAIGVHNDRVAMTSRGLADVHRRLSGDYKTNAPQRFGKRMILTHIRDGWGFVNHRACDDLDDLHRMLCLARGIVEPDHRRGAWKRISDAEGGRGPKQTDVDFDFWTLRVFKNGNGHLAFKFGEDVSRLNRMLGASGALPPTGRNRWGY